MSYICLLCTKQFKSQRALQGHLRIHGPSGGHNIQKKMTHPVTGDIISVKHLEQYNQSLKQCQHCSTTFKPKNNTTGLYCSRSCRASVVNKTRSFSAHIEERKIQNKRNRNQRAKDKRSATKTQPLYKCFHCSKLFSSDTRRKYCSEHSNLYKADNRNRYAFSFNVYDFPSLFDITELKEVGFYHPIKNPNGLTRDHKISVNEAILNNYDSKYIKHPLNCQLMSFQDNNKKKTKSSLSYDNLVTMVDKWLMNS